MSGECGITDADEQDGNLNFRMKGLCSIMGLGLKEIRAWTVAGQDPVSVGD